ncbi:GntR family transcriptional regulator [Enteractinococcus helveticum]|uniref:HTH gntR-type domain-containing protein n=1 Tax=Enteractinococcus helveticum TaxID=1837282 RepID=A0A1B7M0Z3_9MICC|nr:GntR family transcriptional regulator [Enteractinococcus helveticum]OAV62087.1 hypothetical protein A6F49_07240 [Enteractinococcus helveticum]
MDQVDPSSSVPLYLQLVAILRDKIQSADLRPGAKLPSERELCDMYDISRITVRNAISRAENEGLVERIQGMGTFVSAPKYKQSLSEVKSFAATMIESGMVASTEVVTADSVFPDFGLARILNQAVDSPVRYLHLRGMGNETPRVSYESYFPEKRGITITNRAQELAKSGEAFTTLDLYRDSDEHSVTRMEQTFEATTANAEIAQRLAVDEGWPIFRIESVMYEGQDPIEYRIAHYRGDQYKFALERSLDI